MIVRLINWAATYDEEFIILVLVVAKAILFFTIFTQFYHMLSDVASTFAVRTFVVSQTFTMVLTLIDNI